MTSHVRMPLRAVLSWNAGPVPVPVVPMALLPRISSSSRSISGCHGITRWARSLISSREVSTSRLWSMEISSNSVCGSITMPLPMMQVLSP